jgi:hypothetical protein
LAVWLFQEPIVEQVWRWLIGIEPVNKGFAVSAKLFEQDRLSVHTCIFIDLLTSLSVQNLDP